MMIAEENIFNFSQQPKLELSKSRLNTLILQCMCETVVHFKNYLSLGHHKKRKLNENELTQIYTQQAQILIRNKEYPFNIGVEYQDIYNRSSGYSDFFFYPNEQGVETSSLYSVESKRLPTPQKSREKEYVIGNKNNGGIERYKIEVHGKNMKECGLLGFVEQNTFKHWHTTINTWVDDLAKTPNTEWSSNEKLSMSKEKSDHCVLKSIANRKSDKIKLMHLWVRV